MWTTRYTLPPPTSVHLVSRMPHSTLHPTPPFPPFTLGCNATFPRRIPLHTSTNTRTLPLFTRATKPHTRRLHARTSHFAHDFPRGFPPSHSPSSPLIAGFYVRSRWRWRPCRRFIYIRARCVLAVSISLSPSLPRLADPRQHLCTVAVAVAVATLCATDVFFSIIIYTLVCI